jgi:hypothetical protein
MLGIYIELRNDCIVFKELPASIVDLMVANAVLLARQQIFQLCFKKGSKHYKN